MRHKRAWWLWLVIGGLATIGYYLLPYDSVASEIEYNIVALLSCLAIPLGVRLHRPAKPAMWYWFAAGQFTWLMGDLVYDFYNLVLHQ